MTDLSKEMILIKSKIESDSDIFEEVKTRIFLPKFDNENPYIEIISDDKYLLEKLKENNSSLQAKVVGFNGEVESEIRCERLLFEKSKRKFWDAADYFYEIRLTPETLVHHQNIELSGEQNLKYLIFFLTPNDSIFFLCGRNEFDGTIDKGCVFSLSSDIEVEFFEHYEQVKSRKNKKNFIKQLQLIAKVKSDIEISEVRDKVEKFLLIISFISCNRTSTRFLEISSDKEIETIYSGKHLQTSNEIERFGAEMLVERYQFEECANTLYQNLVNSEYEKYIKQSLYSLTPATKSTIEMTYLRLFSGLETIILGYKKIKDMEYTVSETDWTVLRTEIKKCIKNGSIDIPKENRRLIYDKLPELKRPSLKSLVEKMMIDFNVDLGDLWPIFNTSDGKGLIEVRNKFAHGDEISLKIYNSVLVALEHLQFSLERIILTILGWNVEQSTLCRLYISEETYALKDLERARKELTEYLTQNL